ncbi:hypothetical protein EOB59_31730 [Mesorhizobium sp. M7A.F.Ca.MR.176.00.0.0]|uniref:hypothetical protein n=1 Tax=Mesorhizobium sp. M7A.F.Ca.MR.176.00.0.0 TaxID=2496776 RepID=UPI000FD4A8E6|nr:hypothetical protein [Mesorhizobium sp. M7A.F.Ca.MR.176.00.0.0]RUU85558.1 hypothetical protein EOB59_31730 [Mesorhizobium sp. M7A.F.Ca.MR.176.00.0.0]
MSAPMAFCPVHGIFPAFGTVGISGGGTIEISHCVVDCPHPKCGRECEILPGEYTAKEDGKPWEYKVGSSISPEALNALRGIVERIQRNELTPEEAVEQVAQVAPKLGRLMERSITMGLPVLSFLVALIALYLQYEGNRSSDEFETAALDLMARQTKAVEVLVTSKNDERKNRVDDKGRSPTKAKTGKKPVAVKSPSKRRNHVNDERRRKLVQQRKDFPRGR